MSSTVSPATDLASALTTAASLIAVAALVNTAGAAAVSVAVTGTDINMQVPQHAGNEATRAAVVACYARALDAPVRRHHDQYSAHTWIEARGAIAGHPVHVWTIADPAEPTVVA